jgi:iron complex transport system ATP-binding protein
MEVMRLLESLRSQGTTIVAVLHDLNHAARFATQIIAMRDGRVHGSGAPSALLTPETIEEVFGLRCRVIVDPDTGDPVILPR